MNDAAPLVENFFRHEAGRLVPVLTRIFGWRHFELVEDMVQATLLDALQAWRHQGPPANPAGWVHRVARNKILDALRREKTGQRVAAALSSPAALQIEAQFRESEIEDSQLRMMFACCHPCLPPEDQVAFALKALCGFGTTEIARALLLTEDTARRRIQRARRRLQEENVALQPPADAELLERLDAVHQVLYLLFNEGYSASVGATAIRAELCEDAVWLCHLLSSQPRFQTPATHALLALMLFHSARLEAREDAQGNAVLLEEQDRGRWDQRLIQRACEHLAISAAGGAVSRFHLEAAIAREHCLAPRYAATNWRVIVQLYDALIALHPSAVFVLNRAIAVAELRGPEAGLSELRSAAGDPALLRYHLYDAALGELHFRAGHIEEARRCFGAAKAKASSQADRDLLDRKLARTAG